MTDVRMNDVDVFGNQFRLKLYEMIVCIVAPQDVF